MDEHWEEVDATGEWWKNTEKSLEEMMYLDRPMFAQL